MAPEPPLPGLSGSDNGIACEAVDGYDRSS